MKEYYELLKEKLFKRKSAYKAVFTGPMADIVLKDLARFCREFETTFHADPRLHAVLEGRREVLLRIKKHLHLTDDQTWKDYTGKDLE